MSQPLNVFNVPLTGVTLIEASAGTGKTWAISGLVLRHLLEQGHPVQNVLVVTFTQAATAELRDRIRSRLQETRVALGQWQASGTLAAAGDPLVANLLDSLLQRGLTTTVLVDRVEAALAAFDEAPILTIHGYCQRALGDAAFSAGQPFELEQADDRALCAEVVADFWRERVLNGGSNARQVAAIVRQWRPETLTEQLRRRLSRPHSRLCWPEVPSEAADLDEQLDKAWDALRQRWAADWETAQDSLLAAITERQLNAQSYKADKVLAAGEAWARWLNAPARPMATPPAVCALWSQARLIARQNKGKQAPVAPLFAQIDAMLALLEKASAVENGLCLQLLRDLLETAPARLQTLKRERRQISFDDLLHHLDVALQGPGGDALAATLRQRFPVALIDEFQDTDPVQFEIFRRIYRPVDGVAEGEALSLNLVGDPKQAIYSFRQADLQTYLQARSVADHQYHLAHNQRSSEALIDAVNTLFSRHSAAFMQNGLDFQPVGFGEKPRGNLVDLRPGAPTALQAWQLPSEAWLSKGQAQQQAVAACAAEMADLLQAASEGKVYLTEANGQARPLQAGDMAVLVRTNAQGRQAKAALRAVGLAAAELSTQSVFSTPEAAELAIVLWALAEPNQPARLRAALSTRLGGLDAAALARLAQPEALGDWVTWLQRFQQAHQHWLQRGVMVAWQQLGESLNLAGRLLALPEGERALTNVLHLMELLHAEEVSRGGANPLALIRWLDAHRRDAGADESAQLRLESDEKLVRIVTIHRAKGLEYPVVFCPFLWEGDGRRRASLTGLEYPAPEAGGPRRLDFRPSDHPEVQAGQQAAKLESAAEDLRLLYVALTRAVHRCYLVCGPYLAGRSRKESQKALLNWLVAGAPGQAENWLDEGGDPAATEAAWAALPAVSPSIGLAALPQVDAQSARPRVSTAPPATVSRPRPAPRFAAWRLDSFTGLMRGVAEQASPVDHDALSVPVHAAETPDLADIVRFARGARAGECLHAVFEWADFADASTWPKAIAQALQAHPLPEVDNSPDGLSVRQLQGMLENVLNTPLPDGLGGQFCLSALTPRHRLNELEFSLPVPRLQAAALQSVCRDHGLDLPLLAFQPLQGYLRGFMDLVMRIETAHGPRYAVLDWKSNHLGTQAEDYRPERMAAEMAHHGYHLQALIYCLALHRHLRATLPDYDMTRHFGGAYYLFVRGVRPDWSATATSGQPGVVHWQPSPELLLAVDALLAQEDRHG